MKTADEIKAKAQELWAAFDQNAKAGVRFGMFPYAHMKPAEDAGFPGRELAVALMECAQNDGGMIG